MILGMEENEFNIQLEENEFNIQLEDKISRTTLHTDMEKKGKLSRTTICFLAHIRAPAIHCDRTH